MVVCCVCGCGSVGGLGVYEEREGGREGERERASERASERAREMARARF